jgi:acyl carrier protein
MGSSIPALKQVTEEIQELIAELVDGTEVSPTDDLKELGVDSVLMINLIVQLEQKYGICFDDEELDHSYFSTISTLAELVFHKCRVKTR